VQAGGVVVEGEEGEKVCVVRERRGGGGDLVDDGVDVSLLCVLRVAGDAVVEIANAEVEAGRRCVDGLERGIEAQGMRGADAFDDVRAESRIEGGVALLGEGVPGDWVHALTMIDVGRRGGVEDVLRFVVGEDLDAQRLAEGGDAADGFVDNVEVVLAERGFEVVPE
jgi:hypothetical protein